VPRAETHGGRVVVVVATDADTVGAIAVTAIAGAAQLAPLASVRRLILESVSDMCLTLRDVLLTP
jgi:hypothetical protein